MINHFLLILIISISFVMFPAYACDIECVPTDYEFGDDKEIDLEVVLCLDKWWTGKSLGKQCMDLPQYEEMNSKHTELTKLWPNSVIPEFYPMEPYFKQFSYDDIYCLLELDYTECVGDNGPLEDMEITISNAYTILYHGCTDTARNLLSIDKITRADSGYLFYQVCEDFANHIIEVRKSLPIDNSEELKIKFLLLTDNCSYDTNGLEFASLIEIAWYYMEPWVQIPKSSGFCVNSEQLVDFDLFEYDSNTIRVYMIDLKYWGKEIYTFLGYDPPSDIENISGEIFFDDRIILMSFSLKDDFNAPVMTHELLHYALWKNGFSEVEYIDDVHKDWKEYKEIYQDREWIHSNISNKPYFVFG